MTEDADLELLQDHEQSIRKLEVRVRLNHCVSSTKNIRVVAGNEPEIQFEYNGCKNGYSNWSM